MIDVLFVTKNRLRYVRSSFVALLENTDWAEVSGLYLADDASTDGTREWLASVDISAALDMGVSLHINTGPFGGPVAAMNWALDQRSEDADRFAKVDSDFVVCPGWLPEVLKQMTIHPGIDAFGLQPRFGPATPPGSPGRSVDGCRFIGGIGVIRHRAFEGCRPVPQGQKGYFGWTEYQIKHPFRKAWIAPDLPCFCLDLLPFEPWISQAAEYVDLGWMRAWPAYESAGSSYWDWWSEVDA